jgi:hypothetical protein
VSAKFIDIKKIDPNPWRDFSLYPIDDVQVEKLMSSMGGTGGMWNGLPVRKHPDKEDRYQLAMGHHRLEALRRLKAKEVHVEIARRDDDAMLNIMVTENATQQVNNAAAALDSVASIVHRLAKLLLAEDEATFGKILPKVDYASVKGGFGKGKGVGMATIVAYAPEGSLEDGDVKTALGILKDSGRYDALVAMAQAEVDRDNGVKPSKSTALAPARAPRTKIFDDQVAKVFKNSHQLDTFRKAVTDGVAQRYIPVDKQAVLAASIAADAKAKGHEMTGARIRDSVSALVLSGEGLEKTVTKEDRKATLAGQIPDELEKLRSAAYQFSAGTAKLVGLAGKGAVLTDAQIGKFETYVKQITRDTLELRRVFSIKGVK